MGDNDKVPETLDLPANKSLIPGIVNSDEFNKKKGEPDLPLVWQWNHNPGHQLWSVKERPGFLRLKTGRIDNHLLQAKNTLTQRTFGPVSSGITSIDTSKMKDGDFAGLALLQKDYGQLGVRVEGKEKYIVFVNASNGNPKEEFKIKLTGKKAFFKAECDFREMKDSAVFYISEDGISWQAVGKPLQMKYTIPHFMGYRFGLFNYATKSIGGIADFDYFRITDSISEK